MDLLDYIKAERGRLQQIALSAGVSAATVSRIAAGKQNPTLDVLKRIEAATNGAVTVADMSAKRLAPAQAGAA
jgi:transcriptional regulator with XRE-family HTH domain